MSHMHAACMYKKINALINVFLQSVFLCLLFQRTCNQYTGNIDISSTAPGPKHYMLHSFSSMSGRLITQQLLWNSGLSWLEQFVSKIGR